jgi:hypothetical protein
MHRREACIGHIVQMRAERGHVDARNQRRFRRAFQRHVDLRHALAAPDRRRMVTRRAADHREGAAHRTQRAGQRKLAREFAMRERFSGNLPACGENAERDRQVETVGLFREIGWREIDGDATDGKVGAAVLERGAHALAAFADFEIGQADDGKRRQPVGEMDFDDDFGRAPRSGRAAADHGKRHDFT